MFTGSPHHSTDLLVEAREHGAALVRLDADAAVDADRVELAPASVLVDAVSGEIVAIDLPGQVNGHPGAAGARRVNLRGFTLIPGLVNAHTHLDLTHIGPLDHDPARGFVDWIARIRAGRAADEAQIAASVRRGIELCLAGGVVAVGDIAGAPNATPTLVPWRVLVESPLWGVSFVETFGIGTREGAARERLDRLIEGSEAEFAARGRMRLGLSPHAPYTVSPAMLGHCLEVAARLGLPMCMHLAESVEEREFIAEARGPFRAFLAEIGLWHDGLRSEYGDGRRVEAYLGAGLALARLPALHRPFAAVHVNDCPDSTLEALTRLGASVMYCPRSSAYFDAPSRFGPHRYREMLAAGVAVALGTDSIVNLPEASADAATGGISVLEEMRLLWRRDQTRARTLLGMATTLAAPALGLGPELFRIGRGSRPLGMVALATAENPGLEEAFANDAAPRLLWIRK